MKIWSSEHTFNHSWENVVKAALQKYPNPLNPGVIGVDVIDRIVTNDGIIKSHRLLTTQWTVAPWIQRLLGGSKLCHASEHSQIDIKNKTLSLRSRNLTYNNVVNVDEKLVYSIHPDDKEKTLLKQEALITVQNVPLIDYLENAMITKIHANAHKGRQAIEFIIQKMNHMTDDAASTVKQVQTKFQQQQQQFQLQRQEQL
jgi:hypothetical protein